MNVQFQSPAPFYWPSNIPERGDPIRVDVKVDVEDVMGVDGKQEATLTIGSFNGDLDIAEYFLDGLRVDSYRWHSATAAERAMHPDIAVFVRAADAAFTDAVKREASDLIAEDAFERRAVA